MHFLCPFHDYQLKLCALTAPHIHKKKLTVMGVVLGVNPYGKPDRKIPVFLCLPLMVSLFIRYPLFGGRPKSESWTSSTGSSGSSSSSSLQCVEQLIMIMSSSIRQSLRRLRISTTCREIEDSSQIFLFFQHHHHQHHYHHQQCTYFYKTRNTVCNQYEIHSVWLLISRQ